MKTEGGLGRNFLRLPKLVIAFYLKRLFPDIEAIPDSLVQEKTATMTSPLFYFIAFKIHGGFANVLQKIQTVGTLASKVNGECPLGPQATSFNLQSRSFPKGHYC